VSRRDDLERLSSEDLHDLAVRRAVKHLDVEFFWRLLGAVPAAEASIGRRQEAEDDLLGLLARVDDIADSGKGELADALRPFYLDYLERHPDATPRPA
jgi:hypothetical protein